MIKIGSYIIGSIQAANGTILVAFGFFHLVFQFDIIGLILTPIGLICLLFPLLLLYRIRTRSSGKIKTWIIVQFLLIGLFHCGCLVFMFFYGFAFSMIIYVIILTLSSMYDTGLVTVHYMMLLDGDAFLESSLQTIQEKNNNDQSPNMPFV